MGENVVLHFYIGRGQGWEARQLVSVIRGRV